MYVTHVMFAERLEVKRHEAAINHEGAAMLNSMFRNDAVAFTVPGRITETCVCFSHWTL